MKAKPVVHFEMPYKDNNRVAKFYENAFGWDMKNYPEMGNYVLANTTEVDESTQRPKQPGAINGGFFPYGDYGKIPHLVISVENLEEHMELVKKEGGKLLKEPMDIAGVGLFVMIEDTEGNKVGMLQPAEM